MSVKIFFREGGGWMKGTVIGVRDLDFKGRNGERVKKTQYWVSFKNKGTEGVEVEKITWDPEYEEEEAPNFAVGEVVKVGFNRYQRLKFDVAEE
jgi:hypothetical protein